MAHSTITRNLRAADGTLYRLNLLVLLLASFLPFPTKLVSEFIEEERAERVAVVFYGLTLLALGMALTFLLRYAFEQRDLLKDHVDEETAAAGRRYRPSYLLYLAAIGVGLVLPVCRALPRHRALPRRPRAHDPPARAPEVAGAYALEGESRRYRRATAIVAPTTIAATMLGTIRTKLEAATPYASQRMKPTNRISK
jgi:hypothetical protein